MRDQVPTDAPDVRGARELMVLDPAWRADPQIHPSLNGVTLRLRHRGFGWVTFLLPHHEALALGTWLTKNAQPPSEEQKKSKKPGANSGGSKRKKKKLLKRK